MTAGVTRGRLAGLDALRGIAALCVLVFHARSDLLVNGYLAVDLFFMLSGYVMARSFEARLAGGLSPGQFLRERYWRLWPTMAVGALLCLPLFMADYDAALWPVALANLLLVPVPLLGQAFLLNGPAWSIFFELVANALHAALLWRLPTIRVALLAAVMLVVLVGVALLSQHSLELGMRPQSFLAGVPRVLLSYGIGIVLWRTWQDRPALRVPPWLALAALPLYCLANSLQGGSRWPVDLLFVVVGGPAIVAGGLALARVPRWLGWLGAISFPLYAVHSAVLGIGERLGFAAAANVALALGLATFVARADGAVRAQFKARAARAVAAA